MVLFQRFVCALLMGCAINTGINVANPCNIVQAAVQSLPTYKPTQLTKYQKMLMRLLSLHMGKYPKTLPALVALVSALAIAENPAACCGISAGVTAGVSSNVLATPVDAQEQPSELLQLLEGKDDNSQQAQFYSNVGFYGMGALAIGIPLWYFYGNHGSSSN